jgi:hypothetical protein
MPWKINLERLKIFPPKTLGGDLAHFLEKEGLPLRKMILRRLQKESGSQADSF